MKKVLHEYRLFLSYPWDMRVLLTTNLVYGLVMPVIEMFIGAYVMRKSDDPKMVVTYQLAVYTAVPIAFVVNGWLLRHISIKRLYSVGMLLSGVSMVIMMNLPELDLIGLGGAGLLMGVAASLYWANRDFLVLSSTEDANRNYYYGLENFFATNMNIVVPLAVGSFIGWYGQDDSGRVGDAYRIITGVVFALGLVASLIVQRGRFRNPPHTGFVYFRYHAIWNRAMLICLIKAVSDGYIVTAPAMLVMTLVGKESSLGALLSAGGMVSAVLLYLVGRTAGPRYRVHLLAAGLSLFLVGSLANAALYSALGVLLFMLLLVLARPLADFAGFTIILGAMDKASQIEKRNPYSYVMIREFAAYIGRAGGCLLFISLAYYVSTQFALRYALVLIGVLQLLSVPVAHSVLQGCYATETSSEGDSALCETRSTTGNF